MLALRSVRLSGREGEAAPAKFRGSPATWDAEDASPLQSEASSPMSARSTGLSADEHELLAEPRSGRSVLRDCDVRAASSKERRTAVSPFRSLPELHPHEVELRVAVKDLSREVAPEKFRSKTKGVGGFVFGLLVFPQGTKSAPEHARKNRPGRDGDKNNDAKDEEKSKSKDGDKGKSKAKDKDKDREKEKEREREKEKELEKQKEKDHDKENEKEDGDEEERDKDKKDTRWISAFVEARPSEDYPPHWYFEDVQFLVSLINFEDLKKSIVKHDKHTFSPVESSDGKAIDRGWHDFVHCDEATLRGNGFVDPKDDTVCFRASVYLAGGAMKVSPKMKSRYMSLSKIELNGPYEKVPNFLSSLVQLWYHIGHFRSVVYTASNPSAAIPASSGQKRSSCVLSALREVFVRLQARTMPASCSVFCAAFGRRLWSRICEAEPDAFCWEVFRALESELCPPEEGQAASKAAAKAKAGKAAKANTKVEIVRQGYRVLWQAIRELFEFEIEWSAQAIEGGEFSDSSVFQGPVFAFVVRGFSCLEDTLDHYFSPKIIEDGSGMRVRTNRKFKRLPNVLQWYLKRGDYDCCTGLCGLTDTYLSFPRRIDMSKYCHGAGIYNLYAVMVESEEHYWSYIRPEMEGDRGQWYRFDDRETTTCAMSNAMAIDASFGGEEWLCVNYLYGPSAVLTRPKESRACLLVYLKESSMEVLLQEPRLPKISREFQTPVQQQQQRDAPTKAVEVEAEAAAAAAQSLIEELEAQAMKEEKKRKQKQKKKQKEKERKNQAKAEDAAEELTGDENKDEDQEAEASLASPQQDLSEDDEPVQVAPSASQSQREILTALRRREASPEPEDVTCLDEKHRGSRGRKSKGGAKDKEPAPPAKQGPSPTKTPSTQAAGSSTGSARNGAKKKDSGAAVPGSPALEVSAAKDEEKRPNAVAREGEPSGSTAKSLPLSPKKASPARISARGGGCGSGGGGGAPKAAAPPAVAKPSTPGAASGGEAPRPNAAAMPKLQVANGVERHQDQDRPVGAKPRHAASFGDGAVGACACASSSASFGASGAVGSRAAAAAPAVLPFDSEASKPSPSSSSRALPGRGKEDSGGVVVYPEQLVTQELGSIGEYAQFVCKMCNLVVRQPVVLPCAHMFCSTCFQQWVQQKRPDVTCPSCCQAVRHQEVVHFESRTSAGGGALALLHRLYSGMKVRCVYHSELLGAGGLEPLNAEARCARDAGHFCSWRGALLDYTAHLNSCKVHAAMSTPSASSASRATSRGATASSGKGSAPIGAYPASLPQAAPSGSRQDTSSELAWTQVTGAFQALAAWQSPEAHLQPGATLWVTSVDDSGEWAYAQLLQGWKTLASQPSPPAWVPRAVLQRAVYPVCSVFDAKGQAQGLSLGMGDVVLVYHREASGWTFGARVASEHAARWQAQSRQSTPDEVGWFPEACISEPLPPS